VGPLDADDCLRIVEDCRAGREVLPDKQLRRRAIARTYWQEQGK
jgi:NADH-quinone oxidoreductase subunit E